MFDVIDWDGIGMCIIEEWCNVYYGMMLLGDDFEGKELDKVKDMCCWNFGNVVDWLIVEKIVIIYEEKGCMVYWV